MYGHSRQSVYSSVKRRGAIGNLSISYLRPVLLSYEQIEHCHFHHSVLEMVNHDALRTSAR